MSLKKFREQLGLTPLQMAKRWRISRISYTGYEDGVHVPRGGLLESILRIEGGKLSHEVLFSEYLRQHAGSALLPNIVNGRSRPRLPSSLAQAKSPQAQQKKSKADQARKQPAQFDRDEVVEIGARIIYEFKAHAKRAFWEQLEAEKKQVYYERMRSLLSNLEQHGYHAVLATPETGE